VPRRRNPTTTAKQKLKDATWGAIVVGATGLGYGALKGREINLPHIEFLGEAGTYGAGMFIGGHLIGSPTLKIAGGLLAGLELKERGEVWFETDRHKKIRLELEKKKKELEKTIKGLEDEYVDFPEGAYEEPEGTELSGEAVQG
jgi:hypothetical protein